MHLKKTNSRIGNSQLGEQQKMQLSTLASNIKNPS